MLAHQLLASCRCLPTLPLAREFLLLLPFFGFSDFVGGLCLVAAVFLVLFPAFGLPVRTLLRPDVRFLGASCLRLLSAPELSHSCSSALSRGRKYESDNAVKHSFPSQVSSAAP